MKKLISLFFIGFSVVVMAQIADTINLDQLTYSGQIDGVKINDNVYEVDVINKEQIEASAAATLQDLLNHHLNIEITSNNSSGKSGASIFGLNSEYIKVLVNNVPLINDEALGSSTDLSQISLDDIEQIEIVEGAMGVEYGTDAVAGVINIITTKKIQHRLTLNANAIEESVGDEYNFKDEGKRSYTVGLKSHLLDDLNLGINYFNQTFNGYKGELKGKSEINAPGKRGYDWLPKDQQSASFFANYKWGTAKFYYRLNYYHEFLTEYNHTVHKNFNAATNTINPSAQDRDFKTNRFAHLLTYTQDLGNQWKLNANFSYQTQKRDLNQYTIYILDAYKTNSETKPYERRTTYYNKTILRKTWEDDTNAQLGVEFNAMRGKQSAEARDYDNIDHLVDRKETNLDVFAIYEKKWNRLLIRPGIRYLHSDSFDDNLIYSLGTRYVFGQNWTLKTVVGTSVKNPTYDQLYTYFVDSNHNITGNENLKTESSVSVNAHLKKIWIKKRKRNFESKLSFNYINVNDKIEPVQIDGKPSDFTFLNFNKYKNVSAQFQNKFNFNQLTARLGVMVLAESYDKLNDDYNYNVQANASINYLIDLLGGINVFAQYKWYGKQKDWVLGVVNDESIVKKESRKAYQLLDLSLKKAIGNYINVSIGAKNILDVKNIKLISSDLAHGSTPEENLLGYGRSYFGQLIINIPILQ